MLRGGSSCSALKLQFRILGGQVLAFCFDFARLSMRCARCFAHTLPGAYVAHAYRWQVPIGMFRLQVARLHSRCSCCILDGSVFAATGAHVVRRIPRAYPTDDVSHAHAEHQTSCMASRTGLLAIVTWRLFMFGSQVAIPYSWWPSTCILF